LAARFPYLGLDWHPTRNAGVLPCDVGPRSRIPRYWICPDGHEEIASPTKRQENGGCRSCPKQLRRLALATSL
jgi:hypothetical protein